MSQPEIQAAARQIAETLGETNPKPISQINEIVEQCGLEFAQALLQETLQVEAQGGMMLADKSRQRTKGGIFFYLARGKMPRDLAKRIFPGYFQYKPKAKSQKPPVPVLPAFKWEERVEILKPLLDEKGVLSTVKITLIGRPGRIDNSRTDVVITTMTHAAKSPSLPKGVPAPPEKPTLYTVYIAAKQWRKVEAAIANPEDSLIIEGTCAFDEKIVGVAVFAMNITTKMLEVQKRQQQKGAAGEEAAPKQQSSPPAPTKKVRPPVAIPTVPPPIVVPDLPNAPPEAKQKLGELYASASLFRQKVATIQAKPVGEQFGLEMTQKLLKNVEDEIAALEKKYT